MQSSGAGPISRDENAI